MNLHHTKVILRADNETLLDSEDENKYTWLNVGDTVEIEELPPPGNYPPGCVYKVVDVSHTHRPTQAGLEEESVITVDFVPKK